MKFWQRFVLACFLTAAGISWTFLRPAFSGEPPKRMPPFNIEVQRDEVSEKFQSSPLEKIPDPGIRDTANAIKGHINILRKDLDVSGGVSGSKNRTVPDVSDIELKRMLMKEVAFKSKENMQYFDRIAKAFGYNKNPLFTVDDKAQSKQKRVGDSPILQPVPRQVIVHKKIAAVRQNESSNVQWYNARTYPPPVETYVSADNLVVLEKVLMKKKQSHKKRKRPGSSIHLHSEKSGYTSI